MYCMFCHFLRTLNFTVFPHSAFQVKVESSVAEGDFVTYKAKVESIYIKGKILWAEFGHENFIISSTITYLFC